VGSKAASGENLAQPSAFLDLNVENVPGKKPIIKPTDW